MKMLLARYKDQSVKVIKKNNNSTSVFSENRKEHNYTVWTNAALLYLSVGGIHSYH
jgi:hypothetical protein